MSQFDSQSVPCSRSSHNETMIAERRVSPQDGTCRSVRRSELTAPIIGEQLTVIRETRLQQTVQRLENQQGVLEDGVFTQVFADREPMNCCGIGVIRSLRCTPVAVVSAVSQALVDYDSIIACDRRRDRHAACGYIAHMHCRCVTKTINVICTTHSTLVGALLVMRPMRHAV